MSGTEHTEVARGTFAVETFVPQGEPEAWAESNFARFDLAKTFTGDFVGTSVVHMISTSTPVETSKAYAALEHLTGTLAGRSGTFTLLHAGVACADEAETVASWTIVPDSGTDELAGIRGHAVLAMDEHGGHTIEFRYGFAGS